jgi:DNA replication protein DnaC
VQAIEQRRLQGRLRFAKLPARKTLEQFDWTAQPNLDRRLVEDLATLRFVEEKANLLLIGPPGVGKTTLATALGHQAVEAGYRVYYTTAADLVVRTAKAAIEGRWATMALLERATGPDRSTSWATYRCRPRPPATSSKSSRVATSTARSS